MPQKDETYNSFIKLSFFSLELVKLWTEGCLEKELQHHCAFAPAKKPHVFTFK